jgi:hypothetical protein
MKALLEDRVLVDKKSIKRTTRSKCCIKVPVSTNGHVLKISTCTSHPSLHSTLCSAGTGLQVSCQREREREKNRFIALRTLVEKIELAMSGGAERDDELARAQKQRARRRRRSRAANSARAAAGADDRLDSVSRKCCDDRPSHLASPRVPVQR